MLHGNFTDAKIIQVPKLRVIGRNVSLETKVVDSGIWGTVYAVSPLMVMYFLMHGQIDTKHMLKGNHLLVAFSN